MGIPIWSETSIEEAVAVLEALFDIEPNEPMAYIEDIRDHYDWPENWGM